MKIKHLFVSQFLGIKEADLALRKPVNIFLGQNAVGKSSLAASLEFLVTGRARGLGFKKEQGQLLHDGASRLEVAASCEGLTLRRTRTRTTETIRAIEDGKTETDKIPDVLIGLHSIALNPSLYFDLDPIERKAAISRLVAADKKLTVEELTALLPQGVPAEWPSQVLARGFSGAEELAINNRREGKRKLEDLKRVQKPKALVTIDNIEFNFEQIVLDDIEDLAIDLQAQRDALFIKKGTVAAVKKSKPELEKERAKIQSEIAEIEKTIAARDKKILEKELNSVSKRKGEAEAELRSTMGRIAVLQETPAIKIPNLDFEQCPIMTTVNCPVSIKERDKFLKAAVGIQESVQKQFNEEKATARRFETFIAEAEEKIKTNSAILREIESAEKRLVKLSDSLGPLNMEIEQAPQETQTASLDAEIAELDRRLALGNNLHRLYNDYQKQLTEHTEAQAAIIETEAAIEMYDMLAKALSPQGIPATLAERAMSEFKVVIAANGSALGMPFLGISSDDYLPSWNGRPFQLLCESEQWRAELAFQEAIARLSGAPWLIIDRASLLDPENKSAFGEFLFNMALRYDNIFVFATIVDEIPIRSSELPELDTWIVADGKAELLQPKSP